MINDMESVVRIRITKEMKDLARKRASKQKEKEPLKTGDENFRGALAVVLTEEFFGVKNLVVFDDTYDNDLLVTINNIKLEIKEQTMNVK